MELEDFLETEVGVAVAATAALFSPKVRKTLRRGAVYGVAGAMIAGDAIAGFARGVGRGAQQATASTNGAATQGEQTTSARRAFGERLSGLRRAARGGTAREEGEEDEGTPSGAPNPLHGTTTAGMSPGAASSTASNLSGGQATTHFGNGTANGRKQQETPANE